MPTNRSSDGLTLNKITITITGAAITVAMGLGSYQYNQNLEYQEKNLDRLEYKQADIHTEITNLVGSVNDLVVEQKLTYAQQVNMDARIIRNEKKIEEMNKNLIEWTRQLRQYK